MTRALVLADLHWDMWNAASLDPFDGLEEDFWKDLDMVILAGDLSNKADKRWSMVFEGLGKRMDLDKLHVFPGNHDPYDGKIDREDKLVAVCERFGVHYVQRQAILRPGCRFLCCTLWTDMRLGGNVAMNMAEAGRAMNDYKHIRVSSKGFPRLAPKDTVALHRVDLKWLDERLSEPLDGKTIVVTHHAPVAPEPAGTIDAAYGSDLSEFIGRHQPTAWLFGHTHRPQEVMFGQTMVRNVSLGYPDEWRGRLDEVPARLQQMVIGIAASLDTEPATLSPHSRGT